MYHKFLDVFHISYIRRERAVEVIVGEMELFERGERENFGWDTAVKSTVR